MIYFILTSSTWKNYYRYASHIHVIKCMKKYSLQSDKSLSIYIYTLRCLTSSLYSNDGSFLFSFSKHRLIINRNHHFYPHFIPQAFLFSFSVVILPRLRYISVNARKFFFNESESKKKRKEKKTYLNLLLNKNERMSKWCMLYASISFQFMLICM